MKSNNVLNIWEVTNFYLSTNYALIEWLRDCCHRHSYLLPSTPLVVTFWGCRVEKVPQLYFFQLLWGHENDLHWKRPLLLSKPTCPVTFLRLNEAAGHGKSVHKTRRYWPWPLTAESTTVQRAVPQRKWGSSIVYWKYATKPEYSIKEQNIFRNIFWFHTLLPCWPLGKTGPEIFSAPYQGKETYTPHAGVTTKTAFIHPLRKVSSLNKTALARLPW